ncbi:MAG: ParB/RepB/Spo0J family partition protein [Bacillota bacterium]|nr:ParB/RepB/Spo0J family partition protein [Bacillota bacterium]
MAKSAKKGLGKGLGALLGGDLTEETKKEEPQEKIVVETKIVEVPKEVYLKISMIEPNQEQPRKEFNQEQLEELAESIRNYGVLQPIMVQKKGDLYEIIAGERRWRAAKMAGLKEVPVIIRDFDRQKKMEISLIENVQRSDLNPIEEAMAYRQLIEEFGLKQEEIAERVSKNRATIANSLRLLKLDPRVQELLTQGVISNGHARALLAIEDLEQQYGAAELIVKNGLSVREVEKLVKSLLKPAKEKEPKKEERDLSFIFQDLEERMKSIMGTKVMIHRKDKSKGRIEIEYYSEAELERIVELIESIQN